MMMSKRNLKT